MTRSSSPDLVTIEKYQYVYEAQAAQLALQAEEIPAFLNGEEMMRLDWLLGNALGLVQLDVPVDRADQAREILDRIRQRKREQKTLDNECLSCGTAMPAEAPRCPACGWSFAEEIPGETEVAEPEVEDQPTVESSAAVIEDMHSAFLPAYKAWASTYVILTVFFSVLALIFIVAEVLKAVRR